MSVLKIKIVLNKDNDENKILFQNIFNILQVLSIGKILQPNNYN